MSEETIVVAEKQEKPKRTTRTKDSAKLIQKVVIRRLPPTMNEETFVKQIEPIPDHDDLVFVPADYTLGINASSRAYINFLHQEDIFIFKDKFDGYIFLDNKGNEYSAVVEFAPFQSLPKSRCRKKDIKANTIESEQHYISFLEYLAEDADAIKTESKMEYTYQIKDDKKITSTPLIEYLASKNAAKRDESRRKKEKSRQEEKAKKKIQIAKHIPESIREVKEEVVYDDGVVVRTIPSRIDRNKKDKDGPQLSRKERDRLREKERFEMREKERQKNKDRAKEKSEKSNERHEKSEKQERPEKSQRDDKKAEKQENYDKHEKQEKPEKGSKDRKKTQVSSLDQPPIKFQEKPAHSRNDPPAKKEIKRYSERRKENRARNDNPKDHPIEANESSIKEVSDNEEVTLETNEPEKSSGNISIEKKETRESTQKEFREPPEVRVRKPENPAKEAQKLAERKARDERRAREAEERAQRRIKNKDRPALEIYQPKRRIAAAFSGSTCKGENSKSSDEFSNSSSKKSDEKRSSGRTSKNTDKIRKSSRNDSRKKSDDRVNSRKSSMEKQKSEDVLEEVKPFVAPVAEFQTLKITAPEFVPVKALAQKEETYQEPAKAEETPSVLEFEDDEENNIF